jgi:Anti-sigma-K factor rskA
MDEDPAKTTMDDDLTTSGGPGANRPPRGHRRGVARGRLFASVAAAVLAAGVLAGFVIVGSGDDSQTYRATIDPALGQSASAELEVEDGEATLVAEGLPVPEGSFQVWVKRPAIDEPQPSALFLPRDGSAAAEVREFGDDVEAVVVTREPAGGSDEPSEEPFMTIVIS